MRAKGIRLFVLAVLAFVVAAPGSAAAWRPYGGFGIYFGPSFYVAPPVYVPPPVYYAPPPYYYVPPPVAYSPPSGRACYAGAYVCPMGSSVAVGRSCSCPTNTGRAWGQTR
jgi:hypothetical protein